MVSITGSLPNAPRECLLCVYSTRFADYCLGLLLKKILFLINLKVLQFNKKEMKQYNALTLYM